MVKEIANAKREILVQVCPLTFVLIVKDLVDAHKRWGSLEAILDESPRSQKYSSAAFLVNLRIRTFIDARHAVAHPR
jgi:hypothetical protein